MSKTNTKETQDQVLKILINTIDELNEQLDEERSYSQCLKYERGLAARLANHSESIAEIDEWELERCILESELAMSNHEISMIRDQLFKKRRMIDMIEHDISD